MAIKLFNVGELVGNKNTNFYKRVSRAFIQGRPELKREEIKLLREAIQNGTREALETLKTLEQK